MSGTQQCCVPVYQGMARYGCSRKARLHDNGKWYCGIHNPEAERRRREKSEAAYRVKAEAEHRERERTTALNKARNAVVEAAKAWYGMQVSLADMWRSENALRAAVARLNELET